ncbi:hypothetical protein [Escherichia coli]|uniref:hypothetical protein n=1 Tax=Escherichia coli TaxID=562 RepID=UPI003D7C26A8
MSQYPELIAQFSTGNQTRIKQGLIAKAPLEGWYYGSKEMLKNSIYIIVLRLNVVAKFMILIIKGLLRLDYMMKFTTGDNVYA